jgi:hypothetical protein
MLCVRHFGKSGGGGDPMKAGIGSIDWLAAARVGLIVGCDPDDKDKRALTCYKSNIGPIGQSLGYKISFDPDTDDGSFEWTGESDLTAERILTPARQESADDMEQRTDAVSFFEGLLKDGPQLAEDMEKGRRAACISDYAVRKAKIALGIECYKAGGEFGGKGAKWYWKLPAKEGEKAPAGPPPQDVEEGETSPQDVDKSKNHHLVANGSGKSSYSNGLPQDVEMPGYRHLVGELPLTSTPREGGGGANGVPFMITSEMRRRLYELGYKGPDINAMTPADAHAILGAINR